jgi:aspartate kinase
MEVFKFGGASVKDAASIRNIPGILSQFDTKTIVIIISAMGKTTNALERVVNAYFQKNADLFPAYEEVKNYHTKILDELFPDKFFPVFSSIDKLLADLEKQLSQPVSADYNYEYDRIVSYGEMMSSTILSHYLNHADIENSWFDITRLIATDNEFRNAKVNWVKTQENIQTHFIPVMQKNRITVLQGFIGRSENGCITTLGREGSDYSAAIMAYCLNAESVTIWKDVQGVLNADPKFFPKAHIIEELSYSDAVEMAYYGATVLHPKTIKPLENKKIPLYVRSFVNHTQTGTVINSNDVKLPLPVYIFKLNQVLISIFPNDFSFIDEENLRDIFSIFAENKIAVNLMQNTAISFSIVIDYSEEKLEQLVLSLKKHFKVKYNLGLELITIRNYNRPTIEEITQTKEILLEQKTRSTAQLVVRKKQ